MSNLYCSKHSMVFTATCSGCLADRGGLTSPSGDWLSATLDSIKAQSAEAIKAAMDEKDAALAETREALRVANVGVDMLVKACAKHVAEINKLKAEHDEFQLAVSAWMASRNGHDMDRTESSALHRDDCRQCEADAHLKTFAPNGVPGVLFKWLARHDIGSCPVRPCKEHEPLRSALARAESLQSQLAEVSKALGDPSGCLVEAAKRAREVERLLDDCIRASEGVFDSTPAGVKSETYLAVRAARDARGGGR